MCHLLSGLTDTILKDNINEFSVSHGKYFINVVDHSLLHYRKQMLNCEVEDSFPDSYRHLSGSVISFTCYNSQLEGSTAGNTSKMMWKIKLKIKTDDILIVIKNDLQIEF